MHTHYGRNVSGVQSSVLVYVYGYRQDGGTGKRSTRSMRLLIAWLVVDLDGSL